MHYINNIKYLREKNGYSQKRLADSLGVSKSVISSYEQGNTEPPLSRLQQIADHFNVSREGFTFRDLEKDGDFKVAELEGLSNTADPPAAYGESVPILIRQIGQLQSEVDRLKKLVDKYGPKEDSDS